MNSKFGKILNTLNVVATLILGLASFIISVNSYRLSQRQTHLIERQNKLDEGQLKIELRNASRKLIKVSSLLLQYERDYPNIQNCLAAFKVMKYILKG